MLENKSNISIESLWNDFLKENPSNKTKQQPVAYYFCDNKKDANECAELVVKSIKQATATSLWWYEKHKEPLPKIGDLHVITDWNGNARAIIEILKVVLKPYNKITADFAEIEGEGDKSLEYWQKVHKDYFTKEMKPYGDKFSNDMTIVCEYFKTIYIK